MRQKLSDHDRLLGVKTTIFCYDDKGERNNHLDKRNITSVTLLQSALPHIHLNEEVDIDYKAMAETVASLLKAFLVEEKKPQKGLTVTTYPKVLISVGGWQRNYSWRQSLNRKNPGLTI